MWTASPSRFQWESLAGGRGRLASSLPASVLSRPPQFVGKLFQDAQPPSGASPQSSLPSLAPSHRSVEMASCSDRPKVSCVLCCSLNPTRIFANSPFSKSTSVTVLERVLSLRTLTAPSSQGTGGVVNLS